MLAVPYLTVPPPADPRAAGPAATALTLAARPESWRPLLEFRPDARWYRLLTDDGRLQVWLLSWLPGQGTDLHDHGDSSGAFAVAAGSLTERVVGPSREVTRELATGRARVFGPHYVHQVVNTGDVPAVSVHVSAEQAGVDW